MGALAKIDMQLKCERTILAIESRAGTKSDAVAKAWARIDALLDQRWTLTRNLTPA